MTKYVIDSNAWIEYFDGTSKGEKVKEIVESKENDVYTLVLSIAEIISVIGRRGKEYQEALKTIFSISQMVDVNIEISLKAGLIHSQVRQKIKDFGLTDAFVLALAREFKAKVLTGDPHFKGFKEAVMI